MKKHNLLVAGISLAMLVTACKKTDVQTNTDSTVASAPAGTVSADWKTVSNWTSENKDKFSIFSSKSDNSAITQDVAANGLVLVYKKNGTAIMALPGEEKNASGSYFWYYQVSEGNLEILADGYGAVKTPGTEQSFTSFILSADKLADLESKGYTKAELMTLSYENAVTVLK